MADTGSVCSHCGQATLLECIRCSRPYCQDCLQRVDAGLICFECLGQLPPDKARRRRALKESLTLTGIATAANVIFLLVANFDFSSPLALIAGVGAGWFIGERIRTGPRLETGRARWLGIGSIIQGVLAGALLAAFATLLGVVGSAAASLEDLPILYVALVVNSGFFLLAGVAAVFWRLARY